MSFARVLGRIIKKKREGKAGDNIATQEADEKIGRWMAWIANRWIQLLAALVGLVIAYLFLNTLVQMGIVRILQLGMLFSLAGLVFYPREIIQILAGGRKPSPLVARTTQVLAFVFLGVGNELDPEIGVAAVSLLAIALIGVLAIWMGLGAFIASKIPGKWDDRLIEGFEKGFRSWAFWVIGLVCLFLGGGEALTTSEYKFEVRDFEQQTASETYKVYTSFGAKSTTDAGWTFTNVPDPRYMKFDTSGLQGSLTAHKDKTIRVLANGIHLPSRRTYPNILTILADGESGTEYRILPWSFAAFGFVWLSVGVGIETLRSRRLKVVPQANF